MTVAIDEQLLQVLNQCLSQDTFTRTRAEVQLKNLAQEGVCMQSLLRISLENHSFGQRQLAAVTLKNQIDISWSKSADRYQNGPIPDDQTKDWIKHNILLGLSVDLKPIRSLLANTISKIAHLDWPEQWPQLFEHLMQHLSSQNLDSVSGALQVLEDFVKDDMSDHHFPSVAPILVPALHQITGNEVYPPPVRARAIKIISDFVDTIFMVKEEHPEVIESYLEPLLKLWIPGLTMFVGQPATEQSLPLKIESLKTIVKIFQNFPKESVSYQQAIVETVWNNLLTLESIYHQKYVQPTQDQWNEVVESPDGWELNQLVFSSLDLVQFISKRKHFKSLFADQQFMDRLMSCLVTFLQITAQSEMGWEHDMDEFIQEDEEEATVYTVRLAAEETLLTIVESYEQTTLDRFYQTSLAKLSETSHRQQHWWWKVHEAVFYGLGKASQPYIYHIKEKLQFDLHQLFTGVILEDCKAQDYPFLSGRCLWLAGKYCDILSDTIVNDYIGASLQGTTMSPIFQIFAVKAIKCFCTSMDSKKLKPVVPLILKSLCHMAKDAKDEFLFLILETLSTAIKIDDQATANEASSITDIILNGWIQKPEDFLVVELVQELVSHLSHNPIVSLEFQSRMFPTLLEAIQPQQPPALVATALDMLTSLIRNATGELPKEYTTRVFPVVVSMMLSNEEDQLLQNGQDLLQALIHRDYASIKQWTDGQYQGLDLIIRCIAKLLQPEQSESSSIFVGDLVTKLIQKAGADLTPVLSELLLAVLKRLESAKMPSFIQTLVLIFCHLIHSQLATVLDFLSLNQVNGKSGLEIFLKAWAGCFSDFQGYYHVKVSVVAMCLLLQSQDERLGKIQVQGDLVSQTQKIVTRSMAAKRPDTFTIIPFPAKALKLLVEEFQQQRESKMAAKRQMVDEYFADMDSDDEWDEMPEDFEDAVFEDEPELKGDPIYELDLKHYLIDFFKSMQHMPSAQTLAVHLKEHEHKILREALSQ
ncbi:armadillo-type protein [Gorgonomyces haynaldii]|nr:armadillo-type protein [Gorgonomyces haynaldii]